MQSRQPKQHWPLTRDRSCQLHEASADAKLCISDLILSAAGSWQAIEVLVPYSQVFNPPYVPTPDEEVARGGIAAAWAGGDRGRIVIDRVLPMVHKLLSRGGHFFMVTVPENDPQGEKRHLHQ
ncbi:TPA: hypothetical protein ACH3X2_004727 [Trebouxia sp. C0005]